MKAREDGEVASESFSLEVFVLPLADAVASTVAAGAAVDAIAAAFCAASACDCASACRKVAGGVLDCAGAPPFALAVLATAVPAEPAAALTVSVWDWEVPCFERAWEFDFVPAEAGREPESFPGPFASEGLESPRE
jgi:hypothetical protein